MVKIIDGLLYDTKKSEIIYTDIVNVRQYYKTEKGHFFCVSNNGEMWTVSEDTMKKILGENDIEKYIDIFGEPEEA